MGVRWSSANAYDYLNSLGNEIMRQRKIYGLNNGLVIMDRKPSHNYMLTLATDYTKFDANKFFIQHQQDIRKIFTDFIALIQPVVSQYIIE